MKLVEVFPIFAWGLFSLFSLMLIVKLIGRSCASGVKKRKIQILLISAFLLSIYLGSISSMSIGIAAPVSSDHPSAPLLHHSVPVLSTQSQQISQFTEANETVKNKYNILDFLYNQSELILPAIAAIGLIAIIVISPRSFGWLLTWSTVFFFLVLIVKAFSIFIVNLSSINQASSSAPPPAPSPAVNIYLFPRRVPPSTNLTQASAPSSNLSLLSYLSDLWRVFGLIALLGILSLLLHWLSSKGGIVVLPFEVASKELLNTEENKNNRQENYYGKAIAKLLIEELHRIQHIHALPQELVKRNVNSINNQLGNRNFPPLSAIQNQLSDELNEVSTVEIGKTRLPLGYLLLILRRVWPFGGVEGTITGNLQTYGQSMRIVAQIEYKKQISAWEVTGQSMSLESTQDKIRELAYKVTFTMLPKEKLPAETWEAFRNITEAIACFTKYFRIQQTDMKMKELYECKKFLEQAINNDYKLIKQENKRSEILADFFYKIGLAHLLQNQFREAEENMKLALVTDSNRENYHYYYNGLGNIYWKWGKLADAKFEYERSIRHIENLNRDRIKLCSLSNETLLNWLKNNVAHFFYRSCYRKTKFLTSLYLIQKVPEHIKQKILIFPYPYNGLGNLSFEQGNFGEAREFYQDAINQDKEYWKPYHNLGIIYLYQNDFLHDLENYNLAIKNFNLAVKLSRYEDIGSAKAHSNLGLAYFFQAVALQSDLLLVHQRVFGHLDSYGSPNLDLDIELNLEVETLNALFLNVEHLLERALHYVQLAVDIDGENASMHWNLGLVKLWQSTLDEVQSIWGEAVNKARQEKLALCCAAYDFVRQAISQHEYIPLSSYMEKVKSCLKEQYQQRSIKQGTIKTMLKDLLVIRITLLRHFIKNISSDNNYHAENQRILKACQQIIYLQNELRTAKH